MEAVAITLMGNLCVGHSERVVLCEAHPES